jgi:hypothetical protein
MFDYEIFTDIQSFYYYPTYNWFEDEDGDVISCIFEMVTPDVIDLFHYRQETMIVPHRQHRGIGVELYYPGEGDCYCCAHFCECHPDDENDE